MSNDFSTIFNKNSKKYVTLDKADIETPYRIESCGVTSPRARLRFAELGIVAGATVTVTKIAPLGDPIEIMILGYCLCIRASEAKQITVTRTSE